MKTPNPNIRIPWLCAIILALALLPTDSLLAQIESATVSGVVLDSSGLPIPAVIVAARETTTNVSRETVTNAAGLYTFPFLKPGSYEIRVNKANFKQATATLTVQVNQSVRMDFSLEVGHIDEVVTIFATESLIQMENMAVGGQVSEKNLVELPGRNIQTLMGLSAGVANLSLPGYTDNGITPLQPGRGALAQNLNIAG
ncbi:MAG TPA: carboxypeptidase-like regulatory domain-containing protein, partial [Terriglobia bacterium]|nr:carboxypeptidase-like regulatory domain-containing protein [Terriglobia bacterium]